MEKFNIPESQQFDAIGSKVTALNTSKENSSVVLDTIVNEEKAKILEKCKTIGIAAHTLIGDLRKKHAGIKNPDHVLHIVNGKETTEQKAYSDKRLKEVTTLTAQIKELQEAFDKALSSGNVADYNDLQKVYDKLKNSQAKPQQ